MDGGERVDGFDVKRANIRHHDVEAEIFERAHPEGSSIYEMVKVSRSIAYIAENCRAKDLCIDVGCGTGFVTGFELPHYKMAVAADISRKMLEVAKRRLRPLEPLNLVVCDAEFLPFKGGVADMVSVSSVLHHLPRPFRSLKEISRILKEGGFVYVTREPSYQRFRRFFDFFDGFVVQKILRIARFLRFMGGNVDLNIRLEGLDYAKVDVHYPTGFHPVQLSQAFAMLGFKVVYAYSYHWIYPDSNRGWLQTLLTKSNFLVEKLPLANRFGRYVSVIAEKRLKADSV
jgi:SAM-dependent methyltransferase